MVAELNTNVDEATLQLRRAEAAYLGRVVERNADLYQRKLPRRRLRRDDVAQPPGAVAGRPAQAILAERSIKSPFDGVVAERRRPRRPHQRQQDRQARADRSAGGQGGRARRPVRPDQADAGAQVTVNAAISDKPLRAKVWRIDRVMDAASGTFTVLLKVENKGNAIPAGIRCSIRF